MNLLEWITERNRAMTVWDTGLLKISALLVGMVAGASLSAHVNRHRLRYVLAATIAAGVFTVRWFTIPTKD